jgi:hypothetical protein
MLAIHCYTQTTTAKEGATIAGFYLTDFPIVKPDGRFHVAKLFQVDIDLNSNKRIVRASLDEEELTASEAMTRL